MASHCFRTAAEYIQRLLDQNMKVMVLPDGIPIQKVQPVILKPTQRQVEIALTLETGETRVIKAGRRLPTGDGWVVPHQINLAKYEDETEEMVFLIIAQPKAYLPDNILSRADIPKGKPEITLAVSGDFNGGITVAGAHVQGWSCANHPPEGYSLYTSWGTIPGCIPHQMTFRIISEKPEDISVKNRKNKPRE